MGGGNPDLTIQKNQSPPFGESLEKVFDGFAQKAVKDDAEQTSNENSQEPKKSPSRGNADVFVNVDHGRNNDPNGRHQSPTDDDTEDGDSGLRFHARG